MITNNFIDKKYSGNPIISFNTLCIPGTTILVLTLLKFSKAGFLVALALDLLCYFVFATQMYFFKIKAHELTVKNHYLPWIRHTYNLNNIEQISIEKPYRRSTALRIITFQSQSRQYGAGSLRNKDWNELLEDLATLGIKTRKK